MPNKELTKEQQQLYTELKKLVKRANQRLVRLERSFGINTWAFKKLMNRLSAEPILAWSKNNRILLNKSMNITKMKAILKATNQFLNSKTSTVRGIKKIKKTTIKSIATSIGIDDEELSFEEAESLYNIFEDKDTLQLVNYIGASETRDFIQEAKEVNMSENEFLKTIELYLNYGNDKEMLQTIKNVYNKFIK